MRGMVSRMAREELDRLFDALDASDPTPDSEPQAVGALQRLLGFDGQPVSAARLAAAVGWEEWRSRQLLARLPNVERDERGSVVGIGGLTLRPTAHQLVVGGQLRYAWCAWDTLFLPVALDTVVDVRSRCPRTGRPVSLRVTPTGVVERTPDSTVLSFVDPGAIDATDLRGSFCQAVNFLADPAAGEHWRAHGPDRLVLHLDDAFELGRRLILDRCGCRGSHHLRSGA